MTTATLSLAELIELIQPNPRAIADGRRRMTDIWHNRPPDSLPILFAAHGPADAAGCGDMRRHVAEAKCMLYDTAIGLVATARAGSDAQLAIRANTGTGTLATTAGCEQLLSEYGLPWTTHITRTQIEAFDPAADLASLGVMPRVRELYAYFRENLPACVHGYCADTQSPFDLAHLLYGDAIFTDIYDDPDFVHALLEKATTLYIEGTKLMKEWIDEPLDGGYHADMAIANGGSRACDDTATLLGPALIEEFVLPYEQRGLAPFGGGFVHYCGDNAALLEGELANPQMRGLNFGNPERHDFSVIISRLIDAGKCYWGGIPRDAEETLDAYFRRVIGYTGGTRKGLIFMPQLHHDERGQPERVLDLWRSLQ